MLRTCEVIKDASPNRSEQNLRTSILVPCIRPCCRPDSERHCYLCLSWYTCSMACLWLAPTTCHRGSLAISSGLVSRSAKKSFSRCTWLRFRCSCNDLKSFSLSLSVKPYSRYSAVFLYLRLKSCQYEILACDATTSSRKACLACLSAKTLPGTDLPASCV